VDSLHAIHYAYNLWGTRGDYNIASGSAGIRISLSEGDGNGEIFTIIAIHVNRVWSTTRLVLNFDLEHLIVVVNNTGIPLLGGS